MARSPIVIVTPDMPHEADRQAIVAGLVAYNEAAGGPAGFAPFAVLIRDDDGNTLGGLWGRPMGEAGRAAKERGCVGAWLDTFDFQAPGFYKGLGYEVFGHLPDHPGGASRTFLRKLF
ncbi:GNAT family N-acetyltransferase [Stappia sp. F7233]|uniref:GNAT family N-acetyltransferase n=1 Tax=Stappia albiluteola TaxID=2758565 RepID=A0A839AHD3_9HYPH|nr:GNAT family N-acetyltransferase [Stappia albiluteola]MBA5778545.1 GNAT family N-acetyltransferase [Stappia albiluteola]